MDFNRYFTNAELESTLREWAAAYPNILKLSTLGKSYQKKPLWLLTITNPRTGPDTEKPAMWIDANIHATEITGTTTVLMLAHTLLTGFGADERLTRLVNTSTFYIAPRLNPDGAEWAMSTPPRFIRSGVRPYPYMDKDEGLHEQDIDGDGRVLQMRLPDPNGDWKISSLDPRLLEKRQPYEHGGQYYRILPEGLIEDFDGALIKLARDYEGLDFNRNFPFEWLPEGEQSGAGPYPASEPEIKAAVDFVTSHNNINFAITYHTFSRVILRPFSTRPDDELETEDLWVFKKIGKIGTELTGYRCVSTYHDFKYHPKKVTYGAFDDWVYDHLGAYAFTVELWDLPTEAGIKERNFIEWFRDHPHAEDAQILKWVDENGDPGAYVDWYPFEHPQLGPVELGGYDYLYTWGNPPHKWIGAEAARNVQYPLALAEMLPRLEVLRLKGERLTDGRYHVELVVENGGFLPTMSSEQARKRKAVRPVRVELELPKSASLVSGKLRQELGHMQGRSNKLDGFFSWGVTSTDNRARVEWVVQARKGSKLKVKVLSERAGTLEQVLVLE
jgi:murein tripeptide amidase MpaA